MIKLINPQDYEFEPESEIIERIKKRIEDGTFREEDMLEEFGCYCIERHSIPIREDRENYYCEVEFRITKDGPKHSLWWCVPKGKEQEDGWFTTRID